MRARAAAARPPRGTPPTLPLAPHPAPPPSPSPKQPPFLPKAFYDAVYADPSAMKRYHAHANGCHHAMATPWLDGRRTVHFTLHVALPAAFQKIIGAGPA
jgi:hypothetical protein